MEMKKKSVLIIIVIISIIVLLLIGMWFFGRNNYTGQRFPRLRQWFDNQRATEPLNEVGKKFPDSDVYKVKNISTFTDKGGRVDWLPDGDLIVFDRKGADGYYNIYIIGIDGTGERCLTCSNTDIPMHNGNPTWHPSGDYIVFQAQDPTLRPGFLEKWLTHPGGGLNNNLWAVNKEGTKFWQLTSVENHQGVLHPHFSHKGDKLLWAARIGQQLKSTILGQWEIRIAQVNLESDGLRITNVISMNPDDMGVYETHGFSPGGGQITFSASKKNEPIQSFDEFIYDLNTKQLTSLTNTPKEWDEFTQFTPDGKYIVWVSSQRDGTGKKFQRRHCGRQSKVGILGYEFRWD